MAAALWFRQRPSNGFWACAAPAVRWCWPLRCVQGSGRLTLADGLLLGAVASAAVGYVAGAQLSAQMSAEQVICWVLVLSLPLTLPVTW